MPEIIDALGNHIPLLNYQRIVSLVPSQTELLHYLDLEEELIALTRFCVHPKIWHQNKTRIGGTKDIKVERIKSLAPDLIIANKEENVKEQVEELARLFPVYVSDVNSLRDAYTMIQDIGELTGRTSKAASLIKSIKTGFNNLKPLQDKPSCLYFIWKNPYMSIGTDTFIHDMLSRCGFQHLLQDESRYPSLTEEQIKELNPDYIFLSSEPYPFKEKHMEELQQLCPSTQVKLVDGEYFSWYGSRLKDAPDYFQEIIKTLS